MNQILPKKCRNWLKHLGPPQYKEPQLKLLSYSRLLMNSKDPDHLPDKYANPTGGRSLLTFLTTVPMYVLLGTVAHKQPYVMKVV